MMQAYSDLYLDKAQRTLGAMLDFAFERCALPLDVFFDAFIETGFAARFNNGAPDVIAGMSGLELAIAVIHSACNQMLPSSGLLRDALTDANIDSVNPSGALYALADAYTPVGGVSSAYWTGWALAYYQWASAYSFKDICSLVPVSVVMSHYRPYHEMDISHFCALMDGLIREVHPRTRLQERRIAAGLSQSQLAEASGVPVRTLQQYEQRQKDISKAQVCSVVQFAKVLHCEVEDLLEHNASSCYEYHVVSL